MTNTSLSVEIKSIKKTYFEGTASSVTSTNQKGEFDILPQHANLITLIQDYIILNKSTDKTKKFIITKGILKVENNQVLVFLDV